MERCNETLKKGAYMRVSTLYQVFDHETNEIILKDADIKAVVEKIGIPYNKVSRYSISGYKYSRRYTIEKVDIVLNKLVEDLCVTLNELKKMVGEDRFHRLTFTRKRERQAS